MSRSNFSPYYSNEPEVKSGEFDKKMNQGLDTSESDDDLRETSFGTLRDVSRQLYNKSSQQEKRFKKLHRRTGKADSDSSSESDSTPEEISRSIKRSKHAPATGSSKKPVSRIRDIPGLSQTRMSVQEDIRFDPAYGKADLNKTRKNYGFLDEYRQHEIKDMENVLQNKRSSQLISEREREEIKLKMQSLKSRLDTLKNRDLETKVLSDHKKKQMSDFKEGKQSSPYFLKRSEKRRLINKAKFDSMKTSQREKVMERKRKRRLGREFKAMQFQGPDS